MRTYEAIQADIEAAIVISDSEALRSLAHELQALQTPRSEASASNALGVASVINGEYAQAQVYYSRALQVYEELKDDARVAIVICNMGVMYAGTGDNAQALRLYRQALNIYEEQKDLIGEAIVIGNMGFVYQNTGDLPLALEHFRRALQMHENLGDRIGAARMMSSIGNVYWSTGDFPQALEHHRLALQVYSDLGNAYDIAVVMLNIGNVHAETGEVQQALDCYQQSLQLNDELRSRSRVARVTGNMGTVFARSGDYTQALVHFRKALQIHEEQGDRASAAQIMTNMVQALVSVDELEEAAALLKKLSAQELDFPVTRIGYRVGHAQLAEHTGDLDAAWEYLQQALTVAVETGIKSGVVSCHKQLRDLAKRRNDLEGYVLHNDEYMRINEEIRGKETTIKLAMMAKEREIAKKEKETAKQIAVLHSALPKHIADRVARGEVVNDNYDLAAVLFLDIVDFTSISDRIPAAHVVHLLEQIFTSLDTLCDKHSVTKIKTIGDSYMAVAFDGNSTERMAACALDMITAMDDLVVTMPPSLGDASWTQDVGDIRVRVGLHCGPVTAGVIGTQRMQYDVWGDTVNVASRMESTGEPGRIHVSQAFAHALSDAPFSVIERGTVEVKGKGSMTTYWLEPGT